MDLERINLLEITSTAL